MTVIPQGEVRDKILYFKTVLCYTLCRLIGEIYDFFVFEQTKDEKRIR